MDGGCDSLIVLKVAHSRDDVLYVSLLGCNCPLKCPQAVSPPQVCYSEEWFLSTDPHAN